MKIKNYILFSSILTLFSCQESISNDLVYGKYFCKHNNETIEIKNDSIALHKYYCDRGLVIDTMVIEYQKTVDDRPVVTIPMSNFKSCKKQFDMNYSLTGENVSFYYSQDAKSPVLMNNPENSSTFFILK